MKPSSSNRVRSYTRRTLFAIAIILLAGLALRYSLPKPAGPQVAPVTQNSTNAPSMSKPQLDEPAIMAPVEPVAIEHPEEIAATARMYAAHAPLRMPEVANPDSTTNKQILQTMVLKSLALSATPPPPLPAKRR